MDITANVRLGVDLVGGFVVYNFEIELDLIYGNFELSSVVLPYSGEEGLSEIETGNPENGRHFSVYPGLEHLDSFDQIFVVGHQGL